MTTGGSLTMETTDSRLKLKVIRGVIRNSPNEIYRHVSCRRDGGTYSRCLTASEFLHHSCLAANELVTDINNRAIIIVYNPININQRSLSSLPRAN